MFYKSLALVALCFSQWVLAANSKVFESQAKGTLKDVVSEIDSTWGSNITDGTTRVRSGLLKKPLKASSYKTISETNFSEEIDYYEETLSEDSSLETTTRQYSKKDVGFVVEVLAEGNDYHPNNKDDRKALGVDVKTLVQELGNEKDLVTLVTTAKIVKDTDSDGAMRKATSILFANGKTKEVVRIFIVEGRI